MSRGRLAMDADVIGRAAIRLYLRGGGTGVCETGLAERALDMRPAWPYVLNQIYDAEGRLFANQGRTGDPNDPDIPWKPNSGGYLKWKSEQGFINYPNILTGDLFQQLTGAGRPAYIREGLTKYEFGTDAPVSAWSGKQVWWEDGDTKAREDGRSISTDEDGEDVGGLLTSGGNYFVDRHFKAAGPTKPRPVISIGDVALDNIEDAVMDHVTQAPKVRGWYNPGQRQFTGQLRRAGGTPLVVDAGRIYATSAAGNRRRIGSF